MQMRLARVGLPFMATLLLLVTAGCSDSDGSGGQTSGESPAVTADTSGCDEVTALKDSLTALTQIDVTSDGTDALMSAAAEVKTDLGAAASAVSSDLQPAVDQVKVGVDDLETALEGVTSGGGLGAAATEVGTALTELGTALTGLTSAIGQVC